MAGNEIDLFGCKASELVLPNSKETTENKGNTKDDTVSDIPNNELISEGLERAIRGETVKSLMIPEDMEVALPNYVIDISQVETLREVQMEALDTLLHPNGDTAIYAYTTGGLIRLGFGVASILDRILSISIKNLFAGTKCFIYKDFVPGEPLTIISEKDITTMRLSI